MKPVVTLARVQPHERKSQRAAVLKNCKNFDRCGNTIRSRQAHYCVACADIRDLGLQYQYRMRVKARLAPIKDSA